MPRPQRFPSTARLSKAAGNQWRAWAPARDAQWWLPDLRALEGLLLRRGFPAPDAVLQAETTLGGLTVGDVRFGIFASLRALEAQGPMPDGPPEWPDPRPVQARHFTVAGEPAVILQASVDPWLLMGPDGRIWFRSIEVDFGYDGLAFEDTDHLLEILALLWGQLVWSVDVRPEGGDRLWLPGQGGEEVAQTIGAWPVDEAHRGRWRAWVSETARIVEASIPGFVPGTQVQSLSPDDLVLARSTANAELVARSPRALGQKEPDRLERGDFIWAQWGDPWVYDYPHKRAFFEGLGAVEND